MDVKLKGILVKVVGVVLAMLAAIVSMFVLTKRTTETVTLKPEVDVKKEKDAIEKAYKEKKEKVISDTQLDIENIKSKTSSEIKDGLSDAANRSIRDISDKTISDIMADIAKAK